MKLSYGLLSALLLLVEVGLLNNFQIPLFDLIENAFLKALVHDNVLIKLTSQFLVLHQIVKFVPIFRYLVFFC